MSLGAAQNCVTWAIQHGSTISNIKVVSLPGRGNSLVVDGELPPNATARIFIPSAILLTLRNILKFAEEDEAFMEVLEEWSTRIPITSRRAIILLMAFSKRHGSPWSEYLLSLPTEIDSPVFWSSTDLRLLAGTSIDGVAEDKIGFVTAWLAYQQSRPSASKFTGSLTFEELMLYEILVDSRALLSNENDSCMVPVIDYANHTSLLGSVSGGQNSTWQMDHAGFELCTIGEVSNGQEVLFSYGKRGNGELLVKYGFIEQWQVKTGSRNITLELDSPDHYAEYGEPSFRIGSDTEADSDIFGDQDCAYLWLLVLQGEPQVDFQQHTLQGNKFTRDTLRHILLQSPLWLFYCYKACRIAEHYIVRNMQNLESTERDSELAGIAMTLSQRSPEKLRLIDGVRDSEMQTYVLQRDRLHRLLQAFEIDPVVRAELNARGIS